MFTLLANFDPVMELLALLGHAPASATDICADLGITPRKLRCVARELARRDYDVLCRRDKDGKIEFLSLGEKGFEKAIADATQYVDSCP